jgi:hypothetical protein
MATNSTSAVSGDSSPMSTGTNGAMIPATARSRSVLKNAAVTPGRSSCGCRCR